MNAIALFALVAGLLLAGLILLRRARRHRPVKDERRQPGVGPVEGTHGAPWPRGPAGIPKSGDGDDTP